MTLTFCLQKNILNNKLIPSTVNSYYKFGTFFGLKQQLIIVSTRKFTIVDHILACFSGRNVTQSGFIDIGLSKDVRQLSSPIFLVGLIISGYTAPRKFQELREDHIKNKVPFL